MSNFTFEFDSTTLPLTADLAEALTLISGDNASAMDNDHIAELYHECTPTQAADFFSIQHELSEVPPTDADDNVKYNFDNTALSAMVGTLENWHVKSDGATGDQANSSHGDHKPTSAKPTDDEASADVDAAKYETFSGKDEDSEAKYPFSLKIVPMRVQATYGANITDLLSNEAALQTDAVTQIQALKAALLAAFASHTGKSHYLVSNAGTLEDNDGAGNMYTVDTDNSVENFGRRLLRQAVNATTGSDNHSERLVNMFASSRLGSGVSVNDAGDLQTTKFDFVEGDQIKFVLNLTSSGANAVRDSNSASSATKHYEPDYKFVAVLRVGAAE